VNATMATTFSALPFACEGRESMRPKSNYNELK